MEKIQQPIDSVRSNINLARLLVQGVSKKCNRTLKSSRVLAFEAGNQKRWQSKAKSIKRPRPHQSSITFCLIRPV